MDVSKNIKNIRESKGLKQYEIADKLGIDRQNYSRLEKRDKKLTLEQLEGIATALGVSLKELLFGKNDYSNIEMSKLQFAYDLEKNTVLQCKMQKAHLVDNALKFMLNIDNLLNKKTVHYNIGELLNSRKKEYKTFVRCYCVSGNEIFTLATWLKPISQDESYFIQAGQRSNAGEVLFNDNNPLELKQASQIKDSAFSNIQQTHEFWTINFINLTAFFQKIVKP